MKRVLFLLLTCFSISVVAIAQPTDAEIAAQINLIRTHTDGQNTKTFIASVFDKLNDGKFSRTEPITGTGTNTYAVTAETTITSFAKPFCVRVKFPNNNSGASTLNVNGLGAKDIRKVSSTALTSGDITAGQIIDLCYDVAAGYFKIVGSVGSSSSSAGGGGYKAQSVAPSDTTANWIDISSTTVPQAYPIKTYVSGAWADEAVDSDWWDDAGQVISKGRPWIVTYSGQSNVASSFQEPINLVYGANYTGDVTFDPYVTVWNDVTSSFKPYDFADQSGSSGNSWTLNAGANNLQHMGKTIAKLTGRSVRFVGNRLGGTALAAWEAGQPLYTQLVAVINASGIKYADAFVMIHGEGGLTDVTYPTSLFANYQLSYNNLIQRLRDQTWTNSADIINERTRIMSPSHSLGAQRLILGSTELVNAEGTFRALAYSEDEYADHVPTPSRRVVQESATPTTSTSSINLSSATTPISITIPTGLSASVIVGAPIAVVSRANPSQDYVFGLVDSYNNGTGALVIGNTSSAVYNNVYGSGSHTDWDVHPQDGFHWTTLEEQEIGKEMGNVFLNLPRTKRKKPEFLSNYRSNSITGIINSIKSAIPASDATDWYWTSKTLNAGHFGIHWSAGGSSGANGGENPSFSIIGEGNGGTSSTAVDLNLVAQGNLLAKFNEYGTQLGKPLYFAFSSAVTPVNNTSIELNPDGYFGMKFTARETGSQTANYEFNYGAESTLQVTFEEGGLGNKGPTITGEYHDFILTNPYNAVSGNSKIIQSIRSDIEGSTIASGTQTGTLIRDDTYGANLFPNYSIVEVTLTVIGSRSDSPNEARGAFTITRKGLFIRNPTDDFALVAQNTVEILESTAGIVSNLEFAIVGGRFGATLTRGATAGTYTHTSMMTIKAKTN